LQIRATTKRWADDGQAFPAGMVPGGLTPDTTMKTTETTEAPDQRATRLTPEDLPLLVQLTAGLLASGHYTVPTGDETTAVMLTERTERMGYREPGLTACAVQDARMLLRNLREEIQDFGADRLHRPGEVSLFGSLAAPKNGGAA
jgi:hypothetical protein